MIAKLCDFNGEQIPEADAQHKITIAGTEYDCCESCFNAPVILSEMRRTRTRKPAVKKGRPKGSKTRAAEVPAVETGGE